MNEEEITQPRSIPVHIASSDVPTIRPRKQKRTVFQTVVLNANESAQEILPKSENRVCAYVQAIDNDIVLASSKAQAAYASNTVASVPNPQGAYLPKANTVPLRLDGNDTVWAGATTTGSESRVAVTAIYFVE